MNNLWSGLRKLLIRRMVRMSQCLSIPCWVDCEDLVQDVLLILFRGVASGRYIDRGDGYKSLAYKILVNRFKSMVIENLALKRDRNREVPSVYLEVERGTFDGFSKIITEDLLSILDDIDRQALTLRIDGYRVKEISDLQKRPVRTVERHMKKSLDLIKEELILGS
jgi:DNA-directed RNA polymerase specialized sigma24 family protein